LKIYILQSSVAT